MPTKKPTGCTKFVKKDCKSPCTWVSGKGCKSPTTGAPVAKQAAQVKAQKNEITKLVQQKNSLRTDITELMNKLKAKTKEVNDLASEKNALKKALDAANESSKKDVKMMKELSQKTIFLNNRLLTVEDRLKKCNADKEESDKALKECKRRLAQ